MHLREQIETGKKVTNELGASQSELLADYTLVTYNMITTLAKVLQSGRHYDKQGEDPSWLLVGTGDHLNHCIHHLYAYMADGEIEDLEHAFTRLAMAVHLEHESCGKFKARKEEKREELLKSLKEQTTLESTIRRVLGFDGRAEELDEDTKRAYKDDLIRISATIRALDQEIRLLGCTHS